MAITDLANAVRKLTSAEIRLRIAEQEEEVRGLKVLLRSAAARERAERIRREEAQNVKR